MTKKLEEYKLTNADLDKKAEQLAQRWLDEAIESMRDEGIPEEEIQRQLEHSRTRTQSPEELEILNQLISLRDELRASK